MIKADSGTLLHAPDGRAWNQPLLSRLEQKPEALNLGPYNTKPQAAETGIDLGAQMRPNIVVQNNSESSGKETEPFNGDFGLCALNSKGISNCLGFYI